jgi:hypothetical protein
MAISLDGKSLVKVSLPKAEIFILRCAEWA